MKIEIWYLFQISPPKHSNQNLVPFLTSRPTSESRYLVPLFGRICRQIQLEIYYFFPIVLPTKLVPLFILLSKNENRNLQLMPFSECVDVPSFNQYTSLSTY